MKLNEIISALPAPSNGCELEVEITGLACDSRLVRPGNVFVAVSGCDADGHAFVPQALAAGAAALVLERPLEPSPVPYLLVPNARRALALMAAAYHGHAGRQLRVVGVTGTDGKTTTSTLISAILEAAGYPTGLVTTIAAKIGGQTLETGLHTTTPDPLQFHSLLARMRDLGMTHAVVETSSHALDQERTAGAEYDVAVVTNVTSEHLDYHKTYEAYLHAKGKLFDWLDRSYRKPGVPKVAILNADDRSYDYLREFPVDLRLTYGMESPADVYPLDCRLTPSGTLLTVATPAGRLDLKTSLLGRFNAYNILAVAAVGVSQGLPLEAIARGVAAVKGIVGRLDRIDVGQDFAAIVDFAHTPNSLGRLLELARELTSGRVIVVFGCGGLRDREKRPVMGEVAGRLADLVVITSEDPRTEDPADIMTAIAAGCDAAGGREGETYWRIADRAEAIRFAVGMAGRGDLVLATGKGHEKSLCVGNAELPWSEHEVVRQAIVERLFRS